jgi:hypothetical protein
MHNIINSIKEELTLVWTLLNDTERFLKRFGIFEEYESRMKEWRQSLVASTNRNDSWRITKQLIISFRKELRMLGYDLRLGSHDIEIVSSKSDDAPRYGFKRAVLILKKSGILWLTGQENHIDLSRHLASLYGEINFSYLHNVWFRWDASVLQLAAADSETAEQFEILKKFISANKHFVLSSLKNMK